MNKIKIRTSKLTLYNSIYSKLSQDLIKKPTELLDKIVSDNDKKLTIEAIIYNINDEVLKQKYIKLLKLLYVDLIKNSDNWQQIIFRFEYYLLSKQHNFNYVRNKALLYLIITHPCIKLTTILNLKLEDYYNGSINYTIHDVPYTKQLDENVISAINEHIKVNNIVNYIFDVCNVSCIAHMLDHILGCSINRIRSLYYHTNKNIDL